MIYTGIGSRETPENICIMMESVARVLGRTGWILRSGGADGADKAFENGHKKVSESLEIYLPWENFNNSDSKLFNVSEEAYELAKEFHPSFDTLKSGAKKLIARNSHQIMGLDMNTPTNIVICWTPEGKLVGGTAQAIKIAESKNIPVFNMGSYSKDDVFTELSAFLNDVTSKIPIDSFKDRYAFLDTTYTHPIVHEGIKYKTAEIAYQAAKLDLDNPGAYSREFFGNLSDSIEAKRYANKINKRKDWDEVKESIMLDILEIKFSNENMLKMLLRTGKRKIIYYNNIADEFWGINPDTEVGENKLGILLMKIRDSYKV